MTIYRYSMRIYKYSMGLRVPALDQSDCICYMFVMMVITIQLLFQIPH